MANGCPPTYARCGDSAPFFGGSLISLRTVGTVCATGVSLAAGTYNYMSTDWHCSPYGTGTWVARDSGNVIGTVNVAAGHVQAARDFMIIGTPSNTGKIWFGDWKTQTSIRVGSVVRPGLGDPVTCSCGVSGSGHYQYIGIVDVEWNIRGRVIGKGFYAEQYDDRDDPDYPATGWVQPGDSGSPLVSGGSSYDVLQGFLSAGGVGSGPICAPGRHPGFDGDPDDGCYTEYYAMYPDVAIGSIGGLKVKTS
ncbi:hypothetical protein GCM10009789_37100 [Kribbella sancticallisti]|uniref:Trypsin n=1 Tax=Kribbella sancticallisti TaxID=460087 RepID=A0ABN2DP10_9ACTN